MAVTFTERKREKNDAYSLLEILRFTRPVDDPSPDTDRLLSLLAPHMSNPEIEAEVKRILRLDEAA